MIFEQFKHIDPSLVSEIINDFKQLTTRNSYPKGQTIHKEGTICNSLYLIEKGIARAYYYKEGKDITAHFATEQGTITAIDSFIQKKKSRYNIETLEKCTMIEITYTSIQELLIEKPHYEKYIRLFLEQIYIDLAERIEDLLFYSAKERYAKLIKNNPTLIQRVNLGHIASFIGITQETLSRIRAQE